MNKIIPSVILCLRYLISISALSVAVFLRVGIGSNIYAPMSTKPFGKGKGYIHAGVGVRAGTIVLLYVWARLFAVLCFLGNPQYFDINEWSSWFQICKTFLPYPFPQNGLYPSSSEFFLIMSYIVPLTAFLQLLIAYDVLPKEKRPENTFLGFSLLFGWFGKKKDDRDHYMIWQFYEPMILVCVSIGLYVFSFPVHALFFALSAAGLAIQGQAYRLKERTDGDFQRAAVTNREKTLRLQQESDQIKLKKEAKAETSDENLLSWDD